MGKADPRTDSAETLLVRYSCTPYESNNTAFLLYVLACVEFFPTHHYPVFLCLELHFSGFPLATHGGWTTEFRAHRATFTVHAPARHLVSVTLFCMTLRPGSTGRGGPGFQY